MLLFYRSNSQISYENTRVLVVIFIKLQRDTYEPWPKES